MPSYADMAKEAIAALKERGGSSGAAIKKVGWVGVGWSSWAGG